MFEKSLTWNEGRESEKSGEKKFDYGKDLREIKKRSVAVDAARREKSLDTKNGKKGE